MSHTPGPWEWIAEDNGDLLILCRDGDIFEGFVLETKKCTSCYGTESRCTLPTLDNARLIAAAPDLLFAAEQALMSLEEGYDAPKIRDDLRAAIAEAKGEQK